MYSKWNTPFFGSLYYWALSSDAVIKKMVLETRDYF